MQSSRMQHLRFHSHSRAAHDIKASSVPVPILSDARRDLRIEARVHLFRLSSSNYSTRAIKVGHTMRVPFTRERPQPFFHDEDLAKTKALMVVARRSDSVPCRTCASVVHPKTQQTGGFAITS